MAVLDVVVAVEDVVWAGDGEGEEEGGGDEDGGGEPALPVSDGGEGLAD